MKRDELKEVGRVAQIYCQWLRTVCRSEYDYTPYELLEEYRLSAIRNIEVSPVFKNYQFARDHHTLLKTARTDEVLKELHQKPSIIHVCRFVSREHYSKKSCWGCRHIRDYICNQTKEVNCDREVRCRAVVQERRIH